ncbi:MAG: prepilin-type N-terminal cleavage/methylation domain-containing protein [Planctomycetales bacterium]
MARRGFSLFEVLISLAIFVVSAAAIGQLISTGVRGAMHGRLQTQAVIRCESKMSEIVAGITPLQAASEVAYPDDSSWKWSAVVSSGPHPDLYVVEVTAAHPASGNLSEMSYTMTRLVRDPGVVLQMMQEQQQAEEEAAQNASTSSSTGSSGGGAKGGSGGQQGGGQGGGGGASSGGGSGGGGSSGGARSGSGGSSSGGGSSGGGSSGGAAPRSGSASPSSGGGNSKATQQPNRGGGR